MKDTDQSDLKSAVIHHPVFAQFKPCRAVTQAEWTTDWLGVRTRRHYYIREGQPFEDVAEFPPPVDE